MILRSETLPSSADVIGFDATSAQSAHQAGRPARSGPFEAMAGWLRRQGPLFWFTVLLPGIVAGLYFGIIASDVYVSESRFVVRSPEKPARSGLGLLLSSAGFANASEEVRSAQGFIQSRDGLRTLERDRLASAAWGNDDVSIFNRFDPLGFSNSFEELYVFYGDKVGVEFDAETGITTLTVKAYSAKDAQSINRRLLESAEGLVNRLNLRGQTDLVRYAEREVAEAVAQARTAALALAAYRNSAGLIDPERQATVQLQMVSKLQDELIGARMQLMQLSAIAGQNPQIPLLRVRIQGLQQAINEQTSQVAGNSKSLSAAAAQYQRVQLQREFADRQLAAALVALQDARNEARRQSAYVERVAQPSLPDVAMEPRRIRGFLATLIVGLVAWGILALLLAGVKEHKG